MNAESKELIAYLLSKFEIKLESIALIKLVYLCELEAIEKYGRRFTDIKFIHYKHGPYANELQNFYERNKFSSLTTVRKDSDLKVVIETIVEKWKPIIMGGGIQGLINKTYHTLPFQETNYDEEINFENYIGNKYISKIVANKKQNKKLSNPNLKLYSNKKLQSSVDEFLEQFN